MKNLPAEGKLLNYFKYIVDKQFETPNFREAHLARRVNRKRNA